MANNRYRLRHFGVPASGHEDAARPADDRLTEAMNRVCDEIRDKTDPFVARAARRVLERTEWHPGT